MTESLFTETNETPVLDQNKNYLEELVGDGKKFKTPEELARGKYTSDAYIEILTKRLDVVTASERAAREDAQTRANLKDLIDQLSSNQNQSTSTTTPATSQTDQPVYDPTKVRSEAMSVYQEIEAQKSAKANRDFVMGKLKERYGNNYAVTLREQSSELGLDETFVNTMAAQHPTVFIKTFGLDRPVETQNFQSPPQSSYRSDNFSPQTNTARTWSYYQQMRKTNPNLYNDPKTAVQMHKDYGTLGDKFKDGDYNAF